MTTATCKSKPASAVAIIPARFGSTRFPGKPLARQTGKFLIEHVYEQASQARRISRVIVATDDLRILDAVASFGGEAVMTRADHASGTDRLAEVAAGLDDEFIVNVQGDEPELEPADLDVLVELIAHVAECGMATLACPYPPGEDAANPNLVKVVVGASGRALYFSRSPIPFVRDSSAPLAGGLGRAESPNAAYLLHRGLYAYRRDFLLRFAALPVGRLEQLEKLEQLRALEHGYQIAVGVVGPGPAGIDTPEQYAEFVIRSSAGTRNAEC